MLATVASRCLACRRKTPQVKKRTTNASVWKDTLLTKPCESAWSTAAQSQTPSRSTPTQDSVTVKTTTFGTQHKRSACSIASKSPTRQDKWSQHRNASVKRDFYGTRPSSNVYVLRILMFQAAHVYATRIIWRLMGSVSLIAKRFRRVRGMRPVDSSVCVKLGTFSLRSPLGRQRANLTVPNSQTLSFWAQESTLASVLKTWTGLMENARSVAMTLGMQVVSRQKNRMHVIVRWTTFGLTRSTNAGETAPGSPISTAQRNPR